MLLRKESMIIFNIVLLQPLVGGLHACHWGYFDTIHTYGIGCCPWRCLGCKDSPNYFIFPNKTIAGECLRASNATVRGECYCAGEYPGDVPTTDHVACHSAGATPNADTIKKINGSPDMSGIIFVGYAFDFLFLSVNTALVIAVLIMIVSHRVFDCILCKNKTDLLITNQDNNKSLRDPLNVEKLQKLKHLSTYQCCDDDDSWNSWRFIFQIRGIPRVRLTIAPFTVNLLANDIVENKREPHELMKYEWQRYLSFSEHFPQDCKASPLRLAQAGFYWTQNGYEARCFACNVTHSAWSEDEPVWEAHRRISPRCSFVRGEPTDNVPIHNQDYYASSWRGSNPSPNC